MQPPCAIRCTFDDGAELGSYNAQVHWVTHADDLFLVWMPKVADNDNVMGHRAPLFIARVTTSEGMTSGQPGETKPGLGPALNGPGMESAAPASWR